MTWLSKIMIVVTIELFTTATNAQEHFKNRWWPNGETIPCCVVPQQSTVTTTITTPDKTITTTTTTPWCCATPPATTPPAATPPAATPPAPASPEAPVAPPIPKKAVPKAQIVPQQQPPSQSEIYALVICMYAVSGSKEADGCRFPDNGMSLYRSEAECERIADLATRGTTFRPGPGGDTFHRQVKCYKRISNTWSPTS